jgi:hypothetical protein
MNLNTISFKAQANKQEVPSERRSHHGPEHATIFQDLPFGLTSIKFMILAQPMEAFSKK